jgi:hypothetical protein
MILRLLLVFLIPLLAVARAVEQQPLAGSDISVRQGWGYVNCGKANCVTALLVGSAMFQGMKTTSSNFAPSRCPQIHLSRART